MGRLYSFGKFYIDLYSSGHQLLRTIKCLNCLLELRSASIVYRSYIDIHRCLCQLYRAPRVKWARRHATAQQVFSWCSLGSSLVSWSFKKQWTMADSTCTTEYIMASEAGCMLRLLLPLAFPTPIADCIPNPVHIPHFINHVTFPSTVTLLPIITCRHGPSSSLSRTLTHYAYLLISDALYDTWSVMAGPSQAFSCI